MRRPIVSKSERSGTGVDMANLSKAVCHGESDKCRFGNPPQESNFQRLGISRCIAAREAHLEDLRIARAPLRSLTRAEMRRTAARLRPWQGNWKAKFMAFFSLKPSASCLKKAVLVSGLLLTSAQAQAESG